MTVGAIGWTFDVLYAIFWSRIHKKMCVKVKELTQISICETWHNNRNKKF